MAGIMCANCGRHEAIDLICDECRRTYPGDPAALEMMIQAFKLYRVLPVDPAGKRTW
jgi:hypothetical protein